MFMQRLINKVIFYLLIVFLRKFEFLEVFLIHY